MTAAPWDRVSTGAIFLSPGYVVIALAHTKRPAWLHAWSKRLRSPAPRARAQMSEVRYLPPCSGAKI